MASEVARGHRLLPHTADVIVEAWGASDLACAEEGARALIEICVSGESEPEVGQWLATITNPGQDLVRDVLDEVIFAFDTSEHAPVDVHLSGVAELGVEIRLDLALRDDVELTGAAPKAVVILMSEAAGPDVPARCRFIVDV